MRVLGLALALLLLLGSAPAGAEPVVITERDAVKPQPGVDYTRIGTLTPAQTRSAVAVTDSGKVVLWKDGRYLLLDPETGDMSRRLPSPPHASLIQISRYEVWYEGVDAGRTTIYVFSRSTRQMSTFRLPQKQLKQRAHMIGRGAYTIWFGTARPREDNIYENVWSVKYGHPRRLELRARHLGNALRNGDILAWTEPGRIGLRDLAHDGETTWTAMPDGCDQRSNRVQGNGEEFVAVLACDRPEQKAVVVDRSGETKAILEIAMEDGALGTSRRGVFFYDKFYDFASGRLLDISNIDNAEIRPLSAIYEDQPVQVWPQRSGRSLVVRLK